MALILAAYVDTTQPIVWDSVLISMSSPLNQFLIGFGIGLAGGLQASADHLSYYGRPDDLGSYLMDFRARAFNDTACCWFLPNWPGCFLIGAGVAVPLELAVAWSPKAWRQEVKVTTSLAKDFSLSFGAAALGFGLGAFAGIIGGWLIQ